MKIIITGDLHIKLYGDKQRSSEGLPLRLIEIISVIKQMCEYARNNDISKIVIAGDTNDLKNIVHVDAFVMLKEILETYHDIEFIFLHGNHDSSAKGSYKSAIELLRGPENITVITEATTGLLPGIAFVPYSNHIIEDLESIKDDESKVLISHFGLSDAVLSSGISLRTRLSSRDLDKYETVILGHYHKPQQIGKCYYVGSPIQLRRDEAEEEKRFLILDTTDCNIVSEPTLGYRKYHELVIEDIKDHKKIIKLAKELQEQGHYVRIHNKTEDNMSKKVEDIIILEEFKPEHQIRGITTAMSLEAQVDKFMEIEEVPMEDRDYYKTILSGILARRNEQKE